MKSYHYKIIKLIIACFLIIGCNGQTKKENKSIEKDSTYIIGDYLIDPKQKIVGRYGLIGGETWDSSEYAIDTKINFDTTKLFFLGNHIFVKEDLPRDCDLDSVEVIKSNNEFEIFSDKNKIYTFWAGKSSSEVDISKLKKIRNNIYQDLSGDLILLIGDYDLELVKIQQSNDIDINTVEYITNNYIKDKNGLYVCSSKYKVNKASALLGKLTKVCNSDRTNGKTIVSKNYFIYDKKIFSTTDWTLQMKLDKTKMWEIVVDRYSNSSLLTDGKNAYENYRYGYSTHNAKLKPQITNPFFLEGNDIKYVFPIELKFISKNKTDLSFNGFWDYFGNKKPGWLIQTSKGYYFVPYRPDTKSQKINNVFVKNIDTQKDEKLKKEDFYYLKDNIYIYKSHLFFNDKPVYTTMDIKNIQLLCKGDIKSNFISDGKMIMCIDGRTTGYTKKINNIEFILVKENTINDFSKLKIVNQDILIDDNNIYNRDIVIPIQNLKIPIKVYP